MQAAYIPWLVTAASKKRAYDRSKASKTRITRGQKTQTQELAIMLLYQPNGVAASTFHTLEHFLSKGIATLVVSNASLSQGDRNRLSEYAWKIIERPNYGYDFGGYRDAVLHILEEHQRPVRLFVLNDSIWFPLRNESDLVDGARASDADLYGFVLNDRMHGIERHHIQSYFFSFGPRAMSNIAFENYWRDLFLTNNKNLVVRRCEIPMTEAFRRAGFSVAARHRYSDAARALKGLDNITLRQVIAYQAIIDTRNAQRLELHLNGDILDDEWRFRVDADIAAGHLDKYFLIAHPSILIGQLDIPILKKDRQKIYHLQREELLTAGYDANFAPSVREEIRNLQTL